MLNYEKNETKKGKEEEIKYYDSLIDKIESGFTSGEYNTSKIDNGQDEVIITEKMNITLTTTKNQKNNMKNNNITTIDFEKCESLLRLKYNISNDTLLYMKKIDIEQDKYRIPKIEYDIYCNLNGTNLQKLNISICKDIKISFSIPIQLTENLDELNTSSGYFNDICYKSTSESGTDILLNDRRINFIENNKTICQEHCDFTDYNDKEQIANCSCFVKESSDSYSNMNINQTLLYDNFEDNDNINLEYQILE